MGEVFRARDMKLRREVAIKILPAAFSSDPERLRRFEQEACAAAALNHPNTLTIFDIGNYEGSKYIVSELVDGKTLRERLRSGPLLPNDAIEYGIQLARGLAAVHEKGIIHRDLKPENILISNSGKIKILDFGLAKQAQQTFERPAEQTTETGTNFGTIMGTSGYMSPEQVRGRQVNHRSDIFSFGAVLYEMISGRRAFSAQSAVETMFVVLIDQPPRIERRGSRIYAELEQIIWHCLEKDPDHRFQSARELGMNLEKVASMCRGLLAPIPPPARLSACCFGARRHSCCRRRTGASRAVVRRLRLSWRTIS
jgi:eukaryotic-like serine/threonine-protein kinase